MTTKSAFRMCLHILSLLLLCYVVTPSSNFVMKDLVVGLVACRPHQIQTFTQFMNEFDTRGCNHSDSFNGVWCDNSTGAVTKLRLRGCLSGTLKPDSILFGFRQLRYLDLSYNEFISSSLPSEFGNLNKLEVLFLYSNGFLGQVPSSFSNLSMLSQFQLSHNELTGSFPLPLNLTKLTVLDLSYNHFSGTLNPNSSLFGLQHLQYLNLDNNNFSSSFPSEFGNLNRLETLSLSSSGFFGQVPPTISNLTWLKELYLHQNELTGSLPLVHNLPELSILELSNNHFSGTIPSSLFTLPFLSVIDLRENNLTGLIEVPNSSFSSSRLELLFLGHNQFEGKVLEPISKLINLKELDLSLLDTRYPIDLNIFSSLKSLVYLDMSGNIISPAGLRFNSGISLNMEVLYLSRCNVIEFPNILEHLQNLTVVDISHNKIKGNVPKWLWKLPRLISVAIGNNSFTGFGGWGNILVNSSVRKLFLDSNCFEGALPNPPLSIELFSAMKNNFRGDIPLSVCNRSSLAVLGLSYNNFTGRIPRCCPSTFTFLDLRKNNLEGSLPDIFYADSPLKTIDVSYNRLTGKLPSSLTNCTSLAFLSVANNRMEDTFPFWLKVLPKLQVLTLRSNKFFGPISPPDQGPLGFPELRILEISDNEFTGCLPPRYFENWKASSVTMNKDGGLYMVYENHENGILSYTYRDYIDLQSKGLSMEQANILTFYAAIDFSSNRLEGQIPESIGFLKALIALNLSNNAFTCHIPESFANFTELESLDLSKNQLSGIIPSGLKTLSFLAFINVSHNQLKGEIPQGTQITGQPKSSFEGNAGLCGLPLEESCVRTNTPPIQQHKEKEDEEEEVFNSKAAAIGYVPGVLLGLAIAQFIASYKTEWLVKIIGLNKSRNR
ncbi:hypothetical protein N665_0318s0033 [Sinapis alba]|nr:hypothetical protein N665_0318s0033 [Sinapis alba]